ncbi:MAG: hypothetical protein SD837_04690 [Candidatus Electrothrix scaldis]|nr:MAG: hypothetical protein SD837_04690 [Candidatus Electrothrix sp. GW3-3]
MHAFGNGRQRVVRLIQTTCQREGEDKLIRMTLLIPDEWLGFTGVKYITLRAISDPVYARQMNLLVLDKRSV